MPTSLDYYNNHGSEFAASTLEVDMEELYGHFLPHLPPGSSILDAGCGSGRDSAAFLSQGYKVTAFDGSATMAGLASRFTGLPVRHLTFQDLDDVRLYDGVWACASLLHVPRAELGEAFEKLVRATRPDGVIYLSFKFGTGDRVSKGRHFSDFTPESLGEWLTRFPNLGVLKFWVTGDCRPDRGEENWTNALLRVGA